MLKPFTFFSFQPDWTYFHAELFRNFAQIYTNGLSAWNWARSKNNVGTKKKFFNQRKVRTLGNQTKNYHHVAPMQNYSALNFDIKVGVDRDIFGAQVFQQNFERLKDVHLQLLKMLSHTFFCTTKYNRAFLKVISNIDLADLSTKPIVFSVAAPL